MALIVKIWGEDKGEDLLKSLMKHYKSHVSIDDTTLIILNDSRQELSRICSFLAKHREKRKYLFIVAEIDIHSMKGVLKTEQSSAIKLYKAEALL